MYRLEPQMLNQYRLRGTLTRLCIFSFQMDLRELTQDPTQAMRLNHQCRSS